MTAGNAQKNAKRLTKRGQVFMMRRYEKRELHYFCLLLELPKTAAFCRARIKRSIIHKEAAL